MVNKHILFLSTLNFTSNPRLFKEVQLALQQKHQVSVVVFKLGNWSDELEEEKLERLKGAKVHYVSATRYPFLQWLLSTALEQLLRYGPPGLSKTLAALAHSKRTILLFAAARKLAMDNVSLVIAHNLGALYPAYLLSRKFNIPFGFDVEDYHPGELIKGKNVTGEKKRREYLMQQLLPAAGYISYASPLIRKATEELLAGYNPSGRAVTIMNSFPTQEFTLPEKEQLSGPLKLVWFSQNITSGRGLELLLPAFQKMENQLELTLIGNLKEDFSLLLKEFPSVKIKNALPQDTLHKFLVVHDVGIACDVNEADENRKLALTNKLLAYKQAGLFILATDTPAQAQFLKVFPEEGLLLEQNVEDFSRGLATILQNKKIRANRSFRNTTGKKISWENESQKLINCWNTLLYR